MDALLQSSGLSNRGGSIGQLGESKAMWRFVDCFLKRLPCLRLGTCTAFSLYMLHIKLLNIALDYSILFLLLFRQSSTVYAFKCDDF
jgi:hypothetical protein